MCTIILYSVYILIIVCVTCCACWILLVIR
ncbi:hypothetical protein LSH36_339g01020 [Paralvinella palmiformis]|uniref:Uncharacterized protein n=1 Tax=Paralvinella palmiformis TaxID=53620 RepID=A0AAD9JFC9_9ANNE|nr:hypothetical protein LSH36_339g01020 [Paralvinella palmiformis]